jgi:hypothetical protein
VSGNSLRWVTDDHRDLITRYRYQRKLRRISIERFIWEPVWEISMLAGLVEVESHDPAPSQFGKIKETDPFVALSKQDCDMSLGGGQLGQGVVEGFRWMFPADSAGQESTGKAGFWRADVVETP